MTSRESRNDDHEHSIGLIIEFDNSNQTLLDRD